MKGCIAQGREVPKQLIAPLRDSTEALADGAALGQRLADDGYLFLRGVVPREDVLAARGEVFQRLAQVGEIRSPAIEGIGTGESRRQELAGDLGAFWRSVNEGALAHAVTVWAKSAAHRRIRAIDL